MTKLADGRVKRRLRRSDWLALAMDVLSSEGDAELRIDKLCQRLGVTKGSFYAHFRNKADFVDQFVAYWAEMFTQSVVVEIDKLQCESAGARLLALMHLLESAGMARYDIPVRAWATHNATVAKCVEDVDKQRFAYIRQIFYEMDFSGADLDLRTRLFVVYHSASQGMRLPASTLDADVEIKRRHEFLTRL